MGESSVGLTLELRRPRRLAQAAVTRRRESTGQAWRAQQSEQENLAHASEPDEEWKRSEHDTDRHERREIGDQVRDRNEEQSTEERHERVLAATVHAITHAQRTEDQAEKEGRRTHCLPSNPAMALMPLACSP